MSAVHRADELTVVHHDDSTSRFTDVTYLLDRAGLRVFTAGGAEKAFGAHDILTTYVLLTHQRRPGDASRAVTGLPVVA